MAPGRWNRYDRATIEGLWHAIEDLREAVDELVTADEVAEKVAERMHREHVMVIGWGSRIVGLFVVAATLATAVKAWM